MSFVLFRPGRVCDMEGCNCDGRERQSLAAGHILLQAFAERIVLAFFDRHEVGSHREVMLKEMRLPTCFGIVRWRCSLGGLYEAANKERAIKIVPLLFVADVDTFIRGVAYYNRLSLVYSNAKWPKLLYNFAV